MNEDEMFILLDKLIEISEYMTEPSDCQENHFKATVKIGFLIGWIDTLIMKEEREIEEEEGVNEDE
jgi:hypothetical protein